MKEIKAPNKIPNGYKIFFAGTIDMGNSANWQKELKEYFETLPQLKDWTILNPRRDDWDSSWKQHIDNPQFNEQVNWELDAMEKSDLILYVFLPNSNSPITMLELGLHARKNIVVYCPFEFYRSGNIHIVCKKYSIPLYTDWNEFKNSFKV